MINRRSAFSVWKINHGGWRYGSGDSLQKQPNSLRLYNVLRTFGTPAHPVIRVNNDVSRQRRLMMVFTAKWEMLIKPGPWVHNNPGRSAQAHFFTLCSKINKIRIWAIPWQVGDSPITLAGGIANTNVPSRKRSTNANRGDWWQQEPSPSFPNNAVMSYFWMEFKISWIDPAPACWRISSSSW